LTHAHVTLLSGCAFWERQASSGGSPIGEREGLPFTRLSGNRLRELDRFLSILLDEIALRHGGPDHDGSAFARQRNTSRKLYAVERMIGVTCLSDLRLRAIGRVSACLHHCSGAIHSSGLRNDLHLAAGSDPASGDIGHAEERLLLSPDSIIAICRFYRDLGDRLMHGTLPAKARH
jgi:hypothetical protein